MLLLCDFSLRLALAIFTDSNGASLEEDDQETFWRLSIALYVFSTAQYGFAMYMDVFLLYLILKFTKGDSKVNDNVPSIAFVENQ